MPGCFESLLVGLGLQAVRLGASGSDEQDVVSSASLQVGQRHEVVGGESRAEPVGRRVVGLSVFNVEQASRVYLIVGGPCQVEAVLEC